MKKLPTEFKEQWLTALRSGKYKQGAGWLRVDNTFCCLGVAYDIISGKWDKSNLNPDDNWVYKTASSNTNYLYLEDLPRELYAALDQVTLEGECGEPISVQRRLAELNDSFHTFEDIANWIEREL